MAEAQTRNQEYHHHPQQLFPACALYLLSGGADGQMCPAQEITINHVAGTQWRPRLWTKRRISTIKRNCIFSRAAINTGGQETPPPPPTMRQGRLREPGGIRSHEGVVACAAVWCCTRVQWSLLMHTHTHKLKHMYKCMHMHMHKLMHVHMQEQSGAEASRPQRPTWLPSFTVGSPHLYRETPSNVKPSHRRGGAGGSTALVSAVRRAGACRGAVPSSACSPEPNNGRSVVNDERLARSARQQRRRKWRHADARKEWWDVEFFFFA